MTRALLLIGAAMAALPALAAPTSYADAFVARLNLSIEKLSSARADSRALCEDVIGWAVDLDAVAMVTTSGAWSAMKERDQAAYRTALARRLAIDCVRPAKDGLSKPIELAGQRENAGGVTVATRPAGEPLSKPLIWRGRIATDGRFRVTDVLVDGRSAVMSIRDDARAPQNGADPAAALIQSLEK